MQTPEATLATRLIEAEAAHAAYEAGELGGVRDPQWPAWYARYLVEHGIGDLLGRAVTIDELAQQLAACDEAYTREQPAARWSDFYARRLLGTRV